MNLTQQENTIVDFVIRTNIERENLNRDYNLLYENSNSYGYKRKIAKIVLEKRRREISNFIDEINKKYSGNNFFRNIKSLLENRFEKLEKIAEMYID
jgi:uncharacterized protein (UPF0335 family)